MGKAFWNDETRAFRQIAESSSQVMWITDAAGHCFYLNGAWYEFTGQKRGTAVGVSWLSGLHPEDRASTDLAFRDATSRRAPWLLTCRLRNADGSFYEITATGQPLINTAGDCRGYGGAAFLSPISAQAADRQRILTRREIEVLGWVARGKTCNEIGTILGIATRTASSHVDSATRKLQATNRTNAVVEAIRMGELALPNDAAGNVAWF